MTGVSLRAVLAALCLALVAVSAGVSIGMSVSTGEATLSDTKHVSARGLDECFDKGTENVRDVAQQLLSSTVEDMSNQVSSFFSLPLAMADYLLWFTSRTHADVSTDPEWVEYTLIPVLSALARMGATRGVTGVNYIALNFSPKALRLGVLGTSKWGGGVGIYGISCTNHWYLRCLELAALNGVDPAESCTEEEHRAFEVPPTIDDFWFYIAMMRDGETGRIGMNTTHVINDQMLWNGMPTEKPCIEHDPVKRQKADELQCPPDPLWGACTGPLGLEAEEGDQEQRTNVAELQTISHRSFTNAITGGPLDEANQLHWSPANTVSRQISTYIYFPIAHPDGLALFPRAGPRVGYGFLEVRNEHITRQLRKMKIPTAGSRLYSVERHPWTNVTETMTGASHGKTEELRINPADNTWEARPLPVLNSSEPVIREHARWALAHAGGYAALADRSAREWKSSQNVMYWALTGEVADGHGLVWYLSLVVPQGEVLGTINSATEEIRTHISRNNADVDERAELNFTVMMIVVCTAAVILMIAGVCLAVHISQPLLSLEEEMEQVAGMKLEAVNEQRPLSRLSEIGNMQRSFLQMVNNLREYRSYMPQSVLVDMSEGDEEGDLVDTEGDDTPVHEGCAAGPSPLLSAIGSPKRMATESLTEPNTNVRSDSTAGSERSGGRNSNTSAGPDLRLSIPAAEGKRLDPLKLAAAETRSRRVTLLAANKHHWLRTVTQHPAEVPGLISCFVSAFAGAVTAERGIVDLISGDHQFASFNAVRGCLSHRTSAVRCAWGIQSPELMAQRSLSSPRVRTPLQPSRAVSFSPRRFSRMRLVEPSPPPPPRRCEGTAAVCTGLATVGDFGTLEMRRFMLVGGLPCLLQVLERVAAQWRTELIIDNGVYADAQTSWHCKLRERVCFAKRGPDAFNLWQVVGEAARADGGGHEEWMYELDNQTKNPFEEYNKALTMLLQGNVSGARELADAAVEGPSTACSDAWLDLSHRSRTELGGHAIALTMREAFIEARQAPQREHCDVTISSAC
eukprot:TRINITY_DN670_c0_g1_i1.p1 TRINITY_DN670_c0_g1~~TRINITY_DN670_c0_g1_i1.p1  ORF type:complete len:1027 (+),score=176.82 TRINITY_DN670_c0_g1_i1:120-3200(+)